MIRVFLLVLLACVMAPTARAQGNSPTIVIDLGDIFDISGESEAEPLRRLVQSLKQHPSARRFRLIWGSSAPNFGQEATALYDRKSRTLKFYSYTSIGGMGTEEISGEVQHWMLSGVTETMLGKLARKHRGAANGSDGASYFTEIIYYGAKRRDLGSHQVLSAYGKSVRNRKER